MDHARGRHRKRRRGWISRLRWMLGAVLSAIVGVSAPPSSRSRPVKKGKPSGRGVPTPPREPEWVRRYAQAHREHASRTQRLYAAPAAPPQIPRFGWCVDDQGGRGVRPYLVAHEQRRGNRRLAHRARQQHQCGSPAPSLPTRVSQEPDPGEWEELAGLVRRWSALRQPVA